MSLAAALIYWVVVAAWLTVLATIVFFFVRNPQAFGTTRLLLAVLCIDTLRNIFENVYFGLYFGSVYGLLSPALAPVMGRPILLIVPKILNVLAGGAVLTLLLWRWLPLAVQERGAAEQRAHDLEAVAALDFLTGLYSRGHFEMLARAEVARGQRYMRPVSMLMLDIDHFKAVNDHLGHAVGDRVLQNIAALCLAEKRDSDVVARIGGDEFAIMLPETTIPAAMQLAERLRRRVHDNAPTIYGEKIPVTVSIGVCGASMSNSGVESVLRQADEALHEAKQLGRDRVIVARQRAAESLPQAAE